MFGQLKQTRFFGFLGIFLLPSFNSDCIVSCKYRTIIGKNPLYFSTSETFSLGFGARGRKIFSCLMNLYIPSSTNLNKSLSAVS